MGTNFGGAIKGTVNRGVGSAKADPTGFVRSGITGAMTGGASTLYDEYGRQKDRVAARGAADDAAAEAANAAKQSKWDEFMGNVTKGPEFNSLLDQNTGLLKSQYQKAGGSAWQDMQLANQKVQQQAGLDQASKGAAAANAQAQSQLAMRGGLSSGARERIATGGAQNANLNKQNLYRQGEMARMGINTEAEKMNRDAQDFNIKAALGEQNAQRQNEQLKYQERMRALASGNTADAQAKAGGSGGLLAQLGKFF